MTHPLRVLSGLLLASTCSAALAMDDPVPASRPLDSYAISQLVGEHKLGVQWIGSHDLQHAGSVQIDRAGQVLTVHGRQVLGDKRLDIAGHITGVIDDGFVFHGVVTLQGEHEDGMPACVRSGPMHFTTRGIRQYWRLQQMTNPCNGYTDYVDIYFLGI